MNRPGGGKWQTHQFEGLAERSVASSSLALGTHAIHNINNSKSTAQPKGLSVMTIRWACLPSSLALGYE